MLVLLWLYSPLLTSLRAVQQASQLEKVRRKFKVPCASLSALSESVPALDPKTLKAIAEELGEQIPRTSRNHASSRDKRSQHKKKNQVPPGCKNDRKSPGDT